MSNLAYAPVGSTPSTKSSPQPPPSFLPQLWISLRSSVTKLGFYPVSPREDSSLQLSDSLVLQLAAKGGLGASTCRFVLALKTPEADGILYVVGTSPFSERSASDARHVIQAARPETVIAQVNVRHLDAFLADSESLYRAPPMLSEPLPRESKIPWSPYEVFLQSVRNGYREEQYTLQALAEVKHAIFGAEFLSHVAAARKAASDVQANFCILEDLTAGWVGSRAPSVGGNIKATAASSSQSPSLSAGKSTEGTESTEGTLGIRTAITARVMPILEIYAGLFSGEHALPAMVAARKMLTDVQSGGQVEEAWLLEMSHFRLTIHLCRAVDMMMARRRMRQRGVEGQPCAVIDFEKLQHMAVGEQTQVFLTEALRQQLGQSQTTVALLDSPALLGLLRFWDTKVSDDVAAYSRTLLVSGENNRYDGKASGGPNRASTQVCATEPPGHEDGNGVPGGATSLAVGLTAAAATGVSLWSVKWNSFASVVKLLGLKLPAKGALAKWVGSAKLLSPAPGMVAQGKVATGAAATSASGSPGGVLTKLMIRTAQRKAFLFSRVALTNVMRRRGGGCRCKVGLGWVGGGGGLWLFWGEELLRAPLYRCFRKILNERLTLLQRLVQLRVLGKG